MIRFLIACAAASGLTLTLLGITKRSGNELMGRVEPYLNGLSGRPSPLAHPTASSGWWSRMVSAALPFLPQAGESVRQRLVLSGSEMSVDAFRVEQAAWACAGIAIVGWGLPLTLLAGAAVDPVASGVAVALAAVCGWTARDWWLSKEVSRRRVRVREQLPVALDLMTLSLMAGESVPAAVARVGQVMAGDVGREFETVFSRIRSGTPTAEALQRLAEHLPVPAAARVVDSLCTGLERGAPLTETMRGQADDLREWRRRDLIEMGGRREVLMLVPVVFLILPTIVAFALFPGLVSLDLLVA